MSLSAATGDVETLHYEVLIVGAGPAGSMAARAAAMAGAEVLVVEQRHVVGMPVQCAEYVPAQLVGQLVGELDLGRDYIVQKIQGMKTYLPGADPTQTNAPGYTIHRDTFDQALARKAEEAGAKYLLGLRAQARTVTGDVLLGKKGGGMVRIRPKVIIGADGPRSTVGKWIGCVNENLLPGAQMTLQLAAPQEFTEVFFDREFYAGYGWLFPKGKVANIGLGLRRQPSHQVNLRQVLDGFVERLRRQGRVHGDPVGYAAGWIPAEPVRDVVRGNVMLVGDAAGQTHPITGAGVSTAVVCGEMAGQWAARAALENNLELLKGYDEEWRDMFEHSQTRAHERRQLMESCWNDMDQILPKCWVAFREYYAGT